MKPQFILHRQNKIEDLKNFPDSSWGAEIDLRSTGNGGKKIILAHDPWAPGDDFEAWLEIFTQKKIQGPLILNTKEDGLEERVRELVNAFSIQNYFFLDTTWPSLVNWSLKKKTPEFAVRFSHYESVAAIPKELLMAVKYVWIDCFFLKPISDLEELKAYPHLKKCLVSPELQGGSPENFPAFRHLAEEVDLICTKIPEAWKSFLNLR